MLASARLSYLKNERLSDCREEGFLEIDLAGIGMSFFFISSELGWTASSRGTAGLLQIWA